jgi:hypothetical protein
MPNCSNLSLLYPHTDLMVISERLFITHLVNVGWVASTGMGKGRQIAGVIYDACIRGCTKAVWCSVSEDLKVDAIRDFHDIGAGGIPLHLLKDCTAGATIEPKYGHGVFFSTCEAPMYRAALLSISRNFASMILCVL